MYKSGNFKSTSRIAPISLEHQENNQPSEGRQSLSKMLSNPRQGLGFTPMNSNLAESNRTQSKSQSNEDQAKLNYSIWDLLCFSICYKSWMKKWRSQKFKKFTENFNKFTLEDDKFLNEIDIINVLNSIRDLKIIVNDLAKQRLGNLFIDKNWSFYN